MDVYKTLVEHLPGITYLSGSYLPDAAVYVSPQARALLGAVPDDWATAPGFWLTLIHSDDTGRVLHEIARVEEGGEAFRSEYRIVPPSGEEVWIEHSVCRAAGSGEEGPCYVGMITVINARKTAEERLRGMAFVDELTGLLNRRGFFHMAERQLRLSKRNERGGVILYVDVNGLKQINDSLGHGVGDQAILEVADVLRSVFRTTDLVARLGGDEFVVLAAETDSDRRELLQQRLIDRFQAANERAQREFQLSVSTGVAYFDPNSEVDLRALLSEADRGMYRLKHRR